MHAKFVMLCFGFSTWFGYAHHETLEDLEERLLKGDETKHEEARQLMEGGIC